MEERIQSDVLLYFWNKHPDTRRCLFHLPNGGNRNPFEGARLTGMGVVKGAQDVFFLWSSKLHIIEFKTPEGYCSPEQKVAHSAHKRQGFDTYIVRTVEEGIELITAMYLNQPLNNFDHLLSPYSNANLYQQLLEEARQSRLRNASKKRRSA